MRVYPWETCASDVTHFLQEERGFSPTCKSDRHNLFWEDLGVAPCDDRSAIADHGAYQLRMCIRCGRYQVKRWVPENTEDVNRIEAMLVDWDSGTEED